MKKNIFKQIVKDLLLALLAGICISIGGVAYLSCDIKFVGALFFTVGLFIILIANFNLFTGKVCYMFDNKPSYLLKLVLIWFGNLGGAMLSGWLFSLTRLVSISEKCIELCQTKLNDSLLSLFILAIFCNILIFIAVHGFKNAKQNFVKVLCLFFGVSVFVLCGFEHCVADMFYFSFAGLWSWHTLLVIAVITAGNIVGAVFLPLYQKVRRNFA